PARIAQINAEIESLRSLGLELNNTGRFLKGLGSGPDGGQLFEDLGSGLRNAIKSGFTDGFGAAKRSFTQLLKDLTAEFLTSTLIRSIRNIFNPQAGGGIGGAVGTISAASGGSGIGGFFRSIFNVGGGGVTPGGGVASFGNATPSGAGAFTTGG